MKDTISLEQLERLIKEDVPGWRDELRRLCEDRAASRDRLKLLQLALDAMPEEIYIKDLESRFVVANKMSAEINHVSQEDLIGKTDFDIFDEEIAKEFRAEELDIINSRKPFQGNLEGKVLDNGRPRWYQSGKYPLIDEEGKLLGLCGISRHVTTQKQTEAMLLAQSEILEMVASNQPLQDIFRRLTKLNDEQLVGVESSILLLDKDGRVFTEVIAASMPAGYCNQLVGLEIGDNIGSCGTACYRKEIIIVDDVMTDPKWAPFTFLVEPFGYRSCWSAPIIRSDGSVAGSFALYSKNVRVPDSFEMRIVELGRRLAAIAIDSHLAAETIRIAAETDSLTGLTNRSTFNRHLAEMICQAEGKGGRFAVVYIDFDDFKLVNDRHGHQVGDEYLRTVSQRMREAAAAGDTVARLGGDEFVLLMGVDDDQTEVAEKAKGFLENLEESISIDGVQLDVLASAGIAIYPEHGRTADELLGHADAAMYHAKRTGSSHSKIYNPAIDQEIRTRQERIAELRAGIEADEISVDFQPQFDLRSHAIIGFEALARWQHARLGRLAPAYFIQLAEEADLIVPLGESVLRQACGKANLWHERTGKAVRVAINVSAHQFRDGIILKQVERALAESGLPPEYLELELTESVLMQDVRSAVTTMASLKALGVEISLDDFGTGYSNLSALAAFPLDRLKIDRSIVQDVQSNKAAAAIASAIIAMGHKLHMKVLAEGVETQGQLDFLIANKCDFIQGFLLGRPVSFDQTLDLLRDERTVIRPKAVSSRRASGRA